MLAILDEVVNFIVKDKLGLGKYKSVAVRVFGLATVLQPFFFCH